MRTAIRRTGKMVKGFLLLVLLWGIGHSIFILIDGFSDEKVEAGIAVVFGNQVFPNGEVSPRLAARLDKALALYQTGKVNRIFVSGGTGVEGQPEGTVMRNYLTSLGVPGNLVLADDNGNNTQQTAENFQQEFGNDVDEVVVISQYYHISRARLAIHKVGYQKVSGVHADFKWEWRDIYSVIREFPAYYSYLFRTFEISG